MALFSWNKNGSGSVVNCRWLRFLFSSATPLKFFFFQPKNQPLLTPHFRQESSRKTQPERTPTDLSTKTTRVFFRLPKYQKTREISKNRSGKRQQATNKSFQLEVGVGCYLVGYLVWLCIPGEQRFADLGPLGVKDFFGLPKGTFIGSWKRNKKKGARRIFFLWGAQFLSLVAKMRTTHLSGTVSRSIPTKKNQRSKSLIKSFYLGGQGNRKTLSQNYEVETY